MAGRRTKIGEQFSTRIIRMLESPAYRALSLSAHRLLSRIEVELAHHGGKDNGKLPVTFKDFDNTASTDTPLRRPYGKRRRWASFRLPSGAAPGMRSTARRICSGSPICTVHDATQQMTGR